MPESIGPIRWRLQVPHLGLADFRRLQRLVLSQYARRSSPALFAIGLAIGGAIGALFVLATAYWKIWMDGSVAVGIGRRPFLVLEDDAFWWPPWRSPSQAQPRWRCARSSTTG